jgi:hypothetical protein
MKVIELNVDYETRDIAKKLGCRWDETMKKWYVELDSHNKSPPSYKPYRLFALVDTNNVSNDIMKELDCKWNPNYKKWVIPVDVYENKLEHFEAHGLKMLTKITNVYNYVAPPVKTEEEQLAEILALMQCDDEINN